MRRAGPLSRAGLVCQDLGTSVKHTKNQLRDYMEKFQPGSPEDGYFSFYTTRKGLSDHKAT